MGNYPVGKLIAEVRGRKGLSQEELCEGICAVSTLSKIENGIQMPRRRIYHALLQRLGLPLRSCKIPVTEVDMRRSVLEGRIERLIGEKRYQDAADALAEYVVCGLKTEVGRMPPCERLELYAEHLGTGEPACGSDVLGLAEWVLRKLALEMRVGRRGEELDRLELQYAMYQLGILLDRSRQENTRALELLKMALQLTIRDCSVAQLERIRLFSREELKILCHMAVLSYAMGDRTYAVWLLFRLRGYLEGEWVDPEEQADCYPEVLYYLALWMRDDGRTELRMELCERGIAVCLAGGRLRLLPEFLSIKGDILAKNGQTEPAAAVEKQARLLLQMLGDSAGAEALRESRGTCS